VWSPPLPSLSQFYAGCVQVTLAVLVCGWAHWHVLHAVYKPWASQPSMYRLQHASLGLTSFVFLMGLLFKVGTVCVHESSMTTLPLVLFQVGRCVSTFDTGHTGLPAMSLTHWTRLGEDGCGRSCLSA
jgi:hypothetical protein